MSRVFSRALVVLVAAALLTTPLFAASGEYRAVVLSDNPVAYYPLDDASGATATDISGNSLHGTYNNVILTAGALGSATTAAAFDGGSSYVQLPGNWGGGSAITIEAWVHVDNPNGTQAIVAATTTDFVHLQAGTGFCELYLDGSQQNLSSVPDSPAAWHHVVLVVTTGGSKLYVDGVQTGSNASTFTSIDLAGDVRIGMGQNPGRFLNGAVDEVAIYNTALSPARIAAHFAAQADGPITSIASGNWSSPSTWNNGLVPTSIDDVQINGSHTVTVDTASVTVNNLTVLGVLDLSSFGMTVTRTATVAGTINGTADLTLPGTTGAQLIGLGTINAPVYFDTGTPREIPSGESLTLTNTITVAGSVLNNGTITLTDASGLAGGGTWNQGSTGTLNVEGQITVGTFNASAGGNTVNYTGTPVAVRGTTYHHLTTTGALETRLLGGVTTINGNLSIDGYLEDQGYQITGPGTSGTLLMNAGAVLRIGTTSGAQPGNGTSLPVFQSYALSPTSTITYDARANQTIANILYENLTITAFGLPAVNVTKTASGSISINGSLEVDQNNSTVVFDIGSNTLTIDGSLIGAGEITKSAGGLVILEGSNTAFSGTITPTYDITFSGGNAQTIRGTLYDALTINKSAGTATLGGAATATILTLTAGTLFDGGFTLTSNGTVNLGANTTLRIGATMPAGTHITDPTSTVIYEADGNQIIDITPLYGHVIVTTGATAATKTLSGFAPAALNAASLAIVNGPGLATLDLNSRGAVVTGDVTGNGALVLSLGLLEIGGDFLHTGTFVSNSSGVTYNGTGAQIVRGTAYEDLTIDKSSGTATLAGNASVADELFILDGTFNLGSFAIDSQDVVLIDTPGTLELNSGILKIAAYLIIDGAFNGGTTGELWITASSWWGELSGASTAAISIPTLRITGTYGMELDSFAGYDLTVTNLVDLSGGGNIVIESPRKLTVASTGTISRTFGGVQGNLSIAIPAGQMRRFETISDLSGGYAPIEITSASAATINVLVTDVTSTSRVNFLWNLSGDPSTVDLKYYWPNLNWSGDIRTFVPIRDFGTTPTFPAGWVDTTNLFAEVNGVASYATEWGAGIAQQWGATDPSVASFTPTIGATGTAVTLYGSNFTGATDVKFNGVSDPGFGISGDTEIYATVPAGATTGTISVTASTIGTSFKSFTVALPQTIQTQSPGNWSSTATWQGGVVPNAWDNVVVNHDVTVDVSATINDIQLNANLWGSLDLTVDGTMAWNSGTISAGLTISNGSILNIATAVTHTIEFSPLVNDGTINLNAASLHLSNGASLNNDGTININGDFDLMWNGAGAIVQIDNNDSGIIKKIAGAGLSSLGGGAELNNIGFISGESGTLNITSDITTAGFIIGSATSGRRISANPAASQTFQVLNGATMQFSTGGTFETGTDFTGTGTILINSAVELKGSISASATIFRIDAIANITWTTATFTGNLEWKDATFIGNTLQTPPGTVITTISGGTVKIADGLAWQNNGTLELQGAAVHFTNGSSMDIGGLVDIQDDRDFRWDGVGLVASIDNSGTILKSGGSLPMSLGGGATLSGSGTIQSDSGIIEITSPITSDGTFNAAAGATVRFSNGATFLTGASFIGNGTHDVNSAASFAGNIAAPTTGVLMLRGANTMTFNGVTLTGILTWKEASIAGSGLTIDSGATLNAVAGTQTPKVDGGTITIAGSMNAGTTVGFRNGGSFSLAGALASLAITGDHDFGYDGTGGAGTFGLSGLFGKTGGTGTSNVHCGGVCTNTATGTIGAATGILAFPSGLTSNGTLKFPINGPTPLTDFGRIAVTGTVTLSGTSTPEVNIGYVPDGGTAFQVLTFGGRSGDFITKNYTFAGTRTLAETYNANDLTLTASGPTITTLSPMSGGLTGGTAVTITGTGFTGTTPGENFTGTVKFDTTFATPVLWQSATELTATSPAHAAGAVNVTVTNANTEAHTKLNAFTYNASSPTITALSVTSGTVNGGTYTEISGTNLSSVTQVQFGASNATILSTSPILKVRTPAGAGTVNVTVTNPDGSDTLTSAFSYAAALCDITTSGVVSWFRGEGDATDGAGGTNGTNNGGYAAGRVGQAFALNGTQHVSVPDSVWSRPAPNVTIEGWVKFNSVPVGNYAMLFGKTAGTGTFESYGVSYKDNLLYFGVGGPGGITYKTTAFTPSTGVWYHVALTFDDAANDIRLYVDGQLALSAAELASIAYDTHPLTIGAEYENESLAYFFNGSIDEVSVYNRALSAAEVLAIYDADDAGKCYPAAPTVLSINPTSGTTAGGTGVTIAGSSMSGASVTVGNPISIGTNTQSQITATTVATASGTYNVDVTTAAGTGSLTNGFAFIAATTYTSVTNGAWNNPATWGAGSFPQSYDSAVINHDVALDSNRSVTNVTFNGSGTRLSGAFTLTVTGGMTWNGGDLGAALVLDTGSISTITGATTRYSAGGITNNGTVTFDMTGTYTQHTSNFTNNGTFNLQSDATWLRFNSTSFLNTATATFNKTLATGTSTWQGTFSNAGTMNLGAGTLNFTETFGNTNLVNVTAGTLKLSGSGSSSGTFATGAGTGIVEYSAGSHTFSGAFTGSGKLRGSGATVTVSGTASNVELTAGTMTGTSAFAINDSLQWTAGDFVSDALTLASTCTTTISGASPRVVATVVNNGTINFDVTGAFTLNTGNFTNNGTFNLQSNATWLRFNAPIFTNASGGNFNKTTAAGTSTWQGTFVNDGTMTLGAGTLTFSESFSNNNLVTVNSGTLNLNGSGTSTGTFDTVAGTVVAYNAGSHTFGGLQSSGGKLQVTGGTVSANGAAANNLELTGGTINGTALTVDTTFLWSGGDFTGGGVLILGGGCTTTITGANNRAMERVATNDGIVNFDMTGSFTLQTGSITNNAIFNLLSNATWLRFNATTFTNATGANFNKTTGTGSSTWQGTFVNDGTMTLGAGTLTFSESFSNNNQVTINSGALNLNGSGTSSGTFTTAAGTAVAYNAGGSTFNATQTGLGSLQVSGATVTTSGTATVANLDFSSGTMNGAGTMSVSDTFNWTGGSTSGAGTMTLGLLCATTISGSSPLVMERILNNQGSIVYTSTGGLTFQTGNFNNSGTVDLQVDGTWSRFNPSWVMNTGTIKKTAGAGTFTMGVNSDNSGGIVDVESGAINYTQSIAGNASSHYKFGVSSATTAGTMTFTGTPNIGGAQLTAYVVGPFVPQGGQTWSVMSPVSGTFGTTSTSFGAGRSFGVSYPGSSSVLLTASGPTITSLTPNSGTEFGGTSVVIVGTGFAATPTVTFDGVVASVTFNSPTQITATTPAFGGTAPAAIDVVVTNPDGQPATSVGGFTYLATSGPTVSALRPNNANVAGGTTIYIDGTALDTVTSIVFDSTPATIVNQTATLLEVIAPAHAAGNIVVSVTNPAGSANGAFAYNDNWDVARDFSRTVNPTGPWSYGWSATRGSAFNLFTTSTTHGSGYDYWYVGAAPTAFHNPTASPITHSGDVTVPAGTFGGHSGAAGENSVVRWTAPAAGQWQISGAFTGVDQAPTTTDVAVLIGGIEQFSGNVTAYNVPQSFVLRRSLNLGDVVELTVGYGNGNYLDDSTGIAATITPLTGPVVTVTGIAPAIGSPAGGQSVTISGTNFHAGAGVTFDGVAATSITVVNTSTITATTPAHAAGTVDVVVTHPDSADATLTNGYVYSADPHWLNPVSGNWNTAANWSTGVVPTSAQTAYLDATGTYTVTMSGINQTVTGVHVGAGATLSVGSATLILTGPSTIAATGALSVTGTLRFEPGASLTNNGTLTLAGATVATPAGIGSTLTNNATFNITGNVSFGSFNTSGSVGVTINNTGTGTITKSAGAGTTGFDVNWALNNSGALTVTDGTLRLDGSGNTNTGPITITSPGIFEVGTGSFSSTAGSLSGTGTFRSAGGTSTISSTYNVGTAITAGTLTFDTAATTALLTASGGTIAGTGSLTLAGTTHTWTGSTVVQTALTINPGNTLTMSGGAFVFDTGSNLTNNGTFNVTGGGFNSRASIGATWLNPGVVNLSNDVQFGSWNTSGAVGTTIVNSGNINKTAGAATSTLDSTWAVSNGATGTIAITSGILRLEGSGSTNAGAITVTSPGGFEVAGGSFANTTGSIAGSGSFRMTGGTATIANTYAPGATLVSAGNVFFNTAATTNLLTVTGGTISGSGGLTLAGPSPSHTWAGSAELRTSLTIDPGNTLTLSSGAINFETGSNLTNNGVVNVTGGSLNSRASIGAIFANGGTFTLAGDIPFGSYNTSGAVGVTINNSGTLNKTVGTGASAFDTNWVVNNTGTIDIISGTLQFAQNYTQTGTGALTLKLAGTGAGQFSRLTTSAQANLAGTLNINYGIGYTPANADTYQILSFGSRSGDFTTKNGLTFTGGTLNYGLNPTNITLTASAAAALSITKTAAANVAANEVFTYTITVVNAGPDPGSNVSVTDVMQAGMVPSNLSAPSFTCTGTTTLTCTAATLAAGTHTITFDVTAPSAPQAISNVANMTASNDSSGGDNTSTAVTNVGAAQADLAVTKSAAVGTVALGGTVTWNLNVLNNGPSPATSVVITDTLPAGQTVTGATPSTGSCNTVGSVVTCNVGTIGVGNTVTVAINATANEGGTRTNSVAASATEADPNNANDVGTATVTITGDNTLVVTNSNASGTGSLFQAMLDADAGVCPSPCTITFNIATLTPIAGPLPVADVLNLTIDGTTQPGYNATTRVPLIEIDGTSANPGSSGLNVDGDSHVIRGLAIYGFAGPGAAGINIIGGSHTFEANWIGVKPNGVAAPNTQGIFVNSGANVIGSTDPSLGNAIANNGIGIALNFGTANHILGNSIRNNTGLGIDHDGDGVVEILDAGDADTGPNNHQNAPVISLVEITPSDLDVTFSVDSASVLTTNSIRVEVFKADASGEPNEFLGTACFAGRTLTNQLINVPFGSVIAGDGIVATATSFTDGACATVNDGTSEVSASMAATSCVPPPVTITGNTAVCAGGSVILDAGLHSSYFWTPGNFTSQTINVSPTNTTTYTVVVTDASGCSNSDTHTVTVNTPAAVTIAGPTSSCSGNSVVLDAGPGVTYAWLPGGETSQFITVSPTSTTTYSVTVTDGNGCQSGDSHTVTVNTPAPASITPSGPTTFCTGGSVTLTASAGSSFVWTPNGEITSSITVSTSGTYGVTVTDGNGCTSTATPVTVTVNSAPPVAVTGAANSCSGNNVALNATAGFSSYLWQPGNLTGANVNVSPTATTTYTVTATDANGCTSTATHSITVTSAAPVSITGPANSCAGNSVTLNATAGFTSYLWQPGNLTGATINVTPTATTTYTVTATDAGGCTSSTSHTVNVTTPAPATATASGPTTFCAGGSVVLNASAGASYQWLPNGETTSSITVNASGAYSVIVTDAGGCTSTSNSVTVTVNPNPAVTITGPTATCDTAAVTLDAGAGFSSYLWQPGNLTTQSITVNPTTTTTYTVTVTNGSGCSATDTHQVTVTANPTATITAPALICSGSTGHTASVGTQPGATYAWSITNGTITGATNTPSITFNPTGLASVQLNVTVTTGSCTANGSATVGVSPTPATPVITAPASVSASTGGHAASIDPQAGASYFWSINNGTFDSATSGPSITFSAGTSSPVTLSVTVNINGCTASASKTVTVDNVPPPVSAADLIVNKSAPASVTAGSTFTYTINVTNNGPAAATDLSIVDTIPAGLTVLSVNGGPWDCTTAGSQITCTGSAFAGQSSTILIGVRAPAQATTVTNTVTVSSAVEDPNDSNNTDAVSTTINVAPPTCPASAPTLTSPANGATNVFSPVTLSWNTVNSASSYDVWVSTEGVLTLAGSTTGNSLSVSVASGVTTWYVVAHGSNGCESLTSDSRTFTVAPSSTCGNNGKPQIISPSAGANATSPLTISWTPVPQAIGYRVWISVDGTEPQDVGATNGALSLSVNVPPGAIDVFVDALFNACPPSRSDGVAFNVPQPDPCANRSAAALVSPANNSQVNSSSVELRWTAPAGTTLPEYRVWASVDGAPPAVIGTTNETSLREVFERGQVVWYVENLYPGCASTESPRFNFTIPARNECGNTKPTLIAPNGNTVANGSVTFTWNGVADAVAYEVWLALGNESATLIGTTAAGVTTFNYSVPPGNLVWHVRALIDRCPARESTPARFTHEPPAACEGNDRPIAISPIGPAPLTSPADFSWSAPEGATRYELYVHRATQPPALVASTTQPQANDIALAAGSYLWFVRAFFDGCSPLDSGEEPVTIVAPPPACAVLVPPVISAPGQISSGIPFLMQWTPVAGASSYQLQVASNEAFDGAEVVSTTATQYEIVRTNNAASAIGLYARVRAIDSRCTPSPAITAYGPVSAIFVLPAQGSEGAAPLAGSEPVTYTINLGAQFAGQSFTAVPTQTWLTVAPASGVVPAGGMNLIVTADTSAVGVGTSLGGITITLNDGLAGRVKSTGTTTVTSPINMSLVTPVSPSPKSTPPPDALIIPAVANADGINSHFQSDVRVSNTSAQLLKYQLTYIPSGDAGITSGRQTTFSIEPGRTVAMDDILKSWFGTGSASSTGTLEVRPLTQTTTNTSSAIVGALANLSTFASSRTFNVTSNGTFGQHIPAIPFANFIGKSANSIAPTVLSLQQIAQSSKYRTNLGLVEGSGQQASLLVKVFGSNGQRLTDFPVVLNGGQHLQLNGVLAQKGVSSLSDGRIEVEVVSGGGKVTAYASVLDNETSDPLLVSPITLGAEGNRKWVVPGVADLNNGTANWQTDLRVFNAGTTEVPATLSFYSQNGGAPKTANVTIPAGQVLNYDKTLSTVFGAANDGGAVHIDTASDARLIATARTYNQTTQGTYGQFISAVTPLEAAGAGTRPLQLLQVEESDRFRSNIGLAEVMGSPVRVEISVVPPDAKFTALLQVDLGPNEFRQIGSLLKTVGLADTFNARVTVRVVEGAGRVAAYASVIDMKTNDPTYVPAQ